MDRSFDVFCRRNVTRRREPYRTRLCATQGAVGRTIHADVHRHGSDIHLVPHSGPEYFEQDHSLIRLIDDDQAANGPLASLRDRLAAGEYLAGAFSIEMLGFCRQGLLNGRLIAVESCTSRG